MMMENLGGTAGAPMLKIILEQGLSNILVIVTRYFGGILLGTGGLVRAYSGAAEKAIQKAQIIQKAKGYEAKLQIDYNYLNPLRYYLEKMNIKIIKIEYSEQIEVTIEILEDISKQFTNNYNNNNFKISKFDILKEKFVEI
jgi:putative IMPACT (imprinted ancient) family translation regulator